jgi:hypothetical protein
MAGVSHEAFPSAKIQATKKKDNSQASEAVIIFVFKLTFALTFRFPFHIEGMCRAVPEESEHDGTYGCKATGVWQVS